MTTTAMTTDVQIELRPYQRDALATIEAAALRGVRRQVVSLPTGAGKTVIFTHLLVERQTHHLRSEEHTSELQSLAYLVCRLLLEKKKEHRLSRGPRQSSTPRSDEHSA